MKRYQRLIQEQTRIKVVAKAETKSTDHTWLAVFAFAFTGFFFFFSNTLWRALVGG